MASVQQHRPAAVSSPLGKDVLLFRRMTVREQLGQLFEIKLELLSENFEIKLEEVLGQKLAIRVDLPDGAKRYFHAFATQFCFVGQHRKYAIYHATLHPWVWFLSRTADCRIFQAKTVPDIIQEVFREHGFSDFENLLSGSYRTWDYCVQYRETDLNFVSRLMEHEGIYFYFKHEESKHTLVLSDSYSSHSPVSGYQEVPYFPKNDRRERDHLFDWVVSRQVQSGAYVLRDFDFERPKTDLQKKSSIKGPHAKNDFEVFDYPGSYVKSGDGDLYIKARMEELTAQHELVEGHGNARGLSVGRLFSLTKYPRSDQNREYLVVSAVHELEDNAYETVSSKGEGVGYNCSLTAIPSGQPYRPPRVTPKPAVKGPQTAMVVGKQGEEIWTDKYGRVKVQFHWDRYGKQDENSSCWVRVAQTWAGKSWGAMHIPRIGQEVIVHFLEGDPDQPIIVGRVYNGDHMPPYALPDNQTQSGIKSRSTKEGDGKTFNELRFEDKKGTEEIYFHAEKDFLRIVENNDTLKVGFDKKDPGNQTIDIYNDRTTTLEKGHEKLQVKTGNRDVIVDKGNDKHQVVTGNRDVIVDKGNDTHEVKTGNREVKISTGNDTLTISQGNQTIKIAAGKATMEAAQSIEFKVGASSIKIEPAKITIKSPQIAITGDAQVQVKAAMTQINGDATVVIKGGIVAIN